MYAVYNNAYLSITKGEEDITHKVINEFFIDRTVTFPNTVGFFAGERFSTVFNTVVSWFASKTPEQIIEEQYDVFIQLRDAPAGQKAFLSILDDLPFLVFEDLRAIQLPLGRSVYSERMQEASLISHTFANEAVSFLMQNNADKPVAYSRKGLWTYYVRHRGGTTSDFKSLLQYYINSGCVDSEGVDYDDKKQVVLHLPFPWTPQSIAANANVW